MITESQKIGLAFMTMKKVKHCRVNFKSHQIQTIEHALYEILITHGWLELNLDHGRCRPKLVTLESTNKYPVVEQELGYALYNTHDQWYLGVKWFYDDPSKDPVWVLFNKDTRFAIWYMGEYPRPDKLSKNMHSFYINNQHCAPGYFKKNGIARILGHGGYIENPILFQKNEWKNAGPNEFVLPANLMMDVLDFVPFACRIINFAVEE